MTMRHAVCENCGHQLYANTHDDAPIPGPIDPSFTTDEGDEPGFRTSECPECGSDELSVPEPPPRRKTWWPKNP